MTFDKSKPAESKARPAQAVPPPPVSLPPANPLPLFRRIDWITFGITTFLVFIGYYLTLAPDLTLEDSGELAVGSYYAGVPHPPGYPVWTLYTWLFTQIPISNIAWRVALSSAVAGAFSCGLLALMVSRGSSLMLESIADFKGLEARWESALCAISGFVAGMLLGFNGFMWSQAVIVEVYTLSVLSFMAVLCCIFRWSYAPEQRRYLYWGFFWFGICFTNHQTLIVAAMGLEVLIMLRDPVLGRHLFIGNSLVFLLGLAARASGALTTFDSNPPLFVIYLVVGFISMGLAVWLSYGLRITFQIWQSLVRDLLFLGAIGYILVLAAFQAQAIDPTRKGLWFLANLGGLTAIALSWYITQQEDEKLRLTDLTRNLLYLTLGYAAFLLLGSITGTAFFGKRLPLFYSVHLIGIIGMAACVWRLARETGLTSQIRFIAGAALTWLLGASFYFYMPLASMTNPPLNWGYPRTVEGFIHALTRGQYEQTNPTSSLPRFLDQVGMYIEGAINEFSIVYLLVGAGVIFLFFGRMQKRERAWIGGLTAVGLCLAFLLLILLNPNTDAQSKLQARVFFTASHIVVAIFIGYSISLLGGLLATQYQRYRSGILWSAAVASGLEMYSVFKTFSDTELPTLRYAALVGFGVAVLFTLAILAARQRAFMPFLLLLFVITPARSVFSHWAENEQRGHLFGYWFGHDMFTPPYGIYPEMARNTILFGGTDPGRFNPTYMIFCESFLDPKFKPNDPAFDRRDVYLITQNALADKTYLDYIRAHYNRSAQEDPYFFSELFRSERERQAGRTNLIAHALLPLDRFFTDLGARIEAARRARGVYPPKEIITPTNEDSQRAFENYITDAAKRLQHDMQFPQEPKQIKPGEGVNFTRDGRVQVSGQVAVMSINGLLTKVIFDKNPDHEFYVEESFPLDWMFPHLSPSGIIMKINREPLPGFTEEMLSKDHEFWTRYSERLVGNWITYDTTVKEICDFSERTYLRHDFTGFKGDPKFARDEVAQKAFSKLRSAIAGIYWWRLGFESPAELRPKGIEDQQRLIKEAEFALKQSYAFCPQSPEALHKYVTLLVSGGRFQEALLLVETSLKFDPASPVFLSYFQQLRQYTGAQSQYNQAQNQFAQLEQQFRDNPTNMQLGLDLASAYFKLQRFDAGLPLLEQLSASPHADLKTLIGIAQIYTQIGQKTQLDGIVAKIKNLLGPLQRQYATNTNDMPMAFQLVSAYLATDQTNLAVIMVDELLARPTVDPSTLYSAATVYHQTLQWPKLEATLEKLLVQVPSHPETLYDLAGVKAILGKNSEALQFLKQAIEVNPQRPGAMAKNLKAEAAADPRFTGLHQNPEFQKLVQ